MILIVIKEHTEIQHTIMVPVRMIREHIHTQPCHNDQEKVTDLANIHT